MLEKLAEAFCDSAYVDGQNYADTLCALTELFYYLKNDTLDSLPDDELIAVMKQCFDGDCEGSLELLAGRDHGNDGAQRTRLRQRRGAP